MDFTPEMEQPATALPRQGPAWLPQLLRTEFFGHCRKHTTGKHEKNQFCLSCCSGPYCPEGLHQLHPGHASVQVRKASHRDVVRIADIQKYLDIANIQAYTINSAKIVFLQSRPQPKLCKGAPKYCDTCHRSLADQVKFCSINCKLVAIHGNRDPDPDLTLSPSTDSWTVHRANSGDGHSHPAPSVSDAREGGVDDSAHHETSTSFVFPSTPKKHGRRASLGFDTPPPNKRRKHSDDGGCPPSPMSVLGSGTTFAHDWLHGPSTPDSHEELSPRLHPRKQFHPARAPFF
jgi:hypothetical protein